MLKIVKLIYNSIIAILFVIVIVMGCISFIDKLNPDAPLRMLSVVSGSMEPSIPTGSIILIIPQSTYRDGDIITYKLGNILVTHRIVYAKNYFLTKGDSNSQIDPETVSKDQIIGKVVIHIPYLGYIQEKTKTIEGLITFVVIPSAIIIVNEIITIFKNSIKASKQSSLRTGTKELIIICMFSGMSSHILPTYSYFTHTRSFLVNIKTENCVPSIIASQQGSHQTIIINSSGDQISVNQVLVNSQTTQITTNNLSNFSHIVK